MNFSVRVFGSHLRLSPICCGGAAGSVLASVPNVTNAIPKLRGINRVHGHNFRLDTS